MRGRRGGRGVAPTGDPGRGIGNRTKCDAHHIPRRGGCEMVLIKAKRLPPRLPRPQGGPNTPKEVPPLAPPRRGSLFSAAAKRPYRGDPSTCSEETGGSTWYLG